MSVSQSRRAFLRGRLRSGPSPIRPPWALHPDEFERLCTQCGECLSACPGGIIRNGDGGFPIVDFMAGECTFCGDCTRVCDAGALRRDDAGIPWTLKATIGDDCLARQKVECRICGENCGEAAIRFQPRAGGSAEPQLLDDRCTGCGACVAPCPVGAIEISIPDAEAAPVDRADNPGDTMQ